MKASLTALVTAAAMACGASNAISDSGKSSKDQKENPYCGKEGYECKADGWDVPDVSKAKFIGERNKEFAGKPIVQRGYEDQNGIKFTTNLYDNIIFSYNVKSSPSHYTYLDSNCDKTFDVRISPGQKYSIPECYSD